MLVLPSGGRYWRINYRYLGKQKTLALGVWPDVTLADARAKRDAARRLLAKGCDPAEQVKLDKIVASVAAANTFKAVAEEWYLKVENKGLAPATLNKIRWLLDFADQSFGKNANQTNHMHPNQRRCFYRAIKITAKSRHHTHAILRSLYVD